MAEHEQYFEYLQKRSKLGLLYRKGWLYPRLKRHLKGKTLDVGCGIGDFTSYRKNTVGIDINNDSVNWCREQGYPVDLMQIDQIPYEERFFDSVIMDNVLEHILNPYPILNEAHRVLNNNGILLIGVPGTFGYTRDDDHKVFYSENKLIETVEKAGFVVSKTFAMPLKLKLLDKYISQYCVYGVFHKKEKLKSDC
tara:strand:+ start:175 stop:759 length:585 start_codon:yes stop_codon:yes gene_type:complete